MLKTRERRCVWRALMEAFNFSESDRETGVNIINTKLGGEEEEGERIEGEHKKTLIKAIEKELEEKHLQVKPEIIDKVWQFILYTVALHKHLKHICT